MAKCASCNSKVDDGAVRCASCGANLARPAAFLQTLGYVVVAVSMIPFAIGEVVSAEGNYVPVIVGAIGLLIGVGMVVSARVKNAGAPARVVEDSVAEPSPGP